jgi:hypothetical protein
VDWSSGRYRDPPPSQNDAEPSADYVEWFARKLRLYVEVRRSRSEAKRTTSTVCGCTARLNGLGVVNAIAEPAIGLKAFPTFLAPSLGNARMVTLEVAKGPAPAILVGEDSHCVVLCDSQVRREHNYKLVSCQWDQEGFVIKGFLSETIARDHDGRAIRKFDCGIEGVL